jgi:ankyrin repeat protein
VVVNWRDPEQGLLSALHCAAAAGHRAVIELLLLNGGDINVQGGVQGKSPLHLAVTCKREDACELLIAKGAKVQRPAPTPF